MGASLSGVGANIAWIDAPGNIRVYAWGESGQSPLRTATAKLIYGISQQFGDERFRWLRLPVLTSYEPSFFERQLIKVCAKKVRNAGLAAFEDHKSREAIDIARDLILPEGSVADTLPDAAFDHDKIRDVLRAHDRTNGSPLYRQNHPVKAMLVDDQRRPVIITKNTNHACRMFHAELNMIERMRAMGHDFFPRDSKLYVSLKPCRMCAAAIIDFIAPGAHFEVIAFADQPGTMTRHDILKDILTLEPGRGA